MGEWIRRVRSDPSMRTYAGSEDVAAVFDPPIAALSSMAALRLDSPYEDLEFLAVPLVARTHLRARTGGLIMASSGRRSTCTSSVSRPANRGFIDAPPSPRSCDHSSGTPEPRASPPPLAARTHRAYEPLGPAQPSQVLDTCRVVRKPPPERRERRRVIDPVGARTPTPPSQPAYPCAGAGIVDPSNTPRPHALSEDGTATAATARHQEAPSPQRHSANHALPCEAPSPNGRSARIQRGRS
jgi:hypothetical protein